MIDGMYPSQLMEVEAMRTSHYRNLKNIVNKHGQHISYPSIDFMQMSRRKKQNHVTFVAILVQLEDLQ